MSNSPQLVKEFNTMNMNILKLNGLYLKTNNILDYANMHLMVIGPSNTPYMNGLYHFTLKFKDYPNVAPTVYYSSNSKIIINPNINYIPYSNVKVTGNSNVTANSINNMNGTLKLDYLNKWNDQSNLLLLINNIKDTIFVTEPFANVIPANKSGNISVILDKYYNVLPLVTSNKDFSKLFYDISKTYLLNNKNNYYNEINSLSGFNGKIVSNILINTNIMQYNFNKLINNI